jgi:signal transduction histidine kinase
MAAVTGEARDHAILLIRLAAVALASTLVLLAGTGVLSLAAAALLLYLAAAVVLRYVPAARRLAFIGPLVDLVAVTALVFAFPLEVAPWVLYTFAIGAAALRYGPIGAVATCALAIVGFDLALAVRGASARATDLWAVQALIAIGLVTAEIAWALAREDAGAAWSKVQARAMSLLLRQPDRGELLRALVGELTRLPSVRGAWVWSISNDQRLKIEASAGAFPSRDLVVSADTLRALQSQGPLDRIVPDLEGVTFPLLAEPNLVAGIAIDPTAPDRGALLGATHDLLADAAQLVVAAQARARTNAEAHAADRALRAVDAIGAQRQQAAVIASTIIEAGDLGGGRAAVVRVVDGSVVAGDLDGTRIAQLARDRRLPAVVAEPDLRVAIVPMGEGRVLAVAGSPENLTNRLGHLTRIAVAARERLAVLADRDRFQRAAQELGRDVEHLGGELRAREDALATAVHELRNPLTAVHGYATLMSRNLQAVQGQLAQLERLMADLLRAEQRLASGEGSVDAVADAREAIGRARMRSGADISLDAPDQPVRLAIDPARFAQLLDNLLANAAKYSPASAPITVSIKPNGREGRVAVIDHGVGLAAEHLERVFERFYRVSSGDAVAGQGLGLSICKEIVATHGGRIWAESAGVGKGSTFTFTLPLAPLPVNSAG